MNKQTKRIQSLNAIIYKVEKRHKPNKAGLLNALL